jgi:hypothetical protein
MTTIFEAAGIAILVLLAGSLPWAGFGPISGLSAWNQRAGVLAPWAIVPMALYLWVYFRFISGGWGADGAERRRANLRANRLPGVVWRAAVPAGLLGFAAILALTAVIARLVRLPAGDPISTPPGMRESPRNPPSAATCRASSVVDSECRPPLSPAEPCLACCTFRTILVTSC